MLIFFLWIKCHDISFESFLNVKLMKKKLMPVHKNKIVNFFFQNATNFLDLAFKNQKKVLETQNKFFLQNLKKKSNFFYPKKIRFSLIKVKVMKGFHYKCT